MPSVNKDGEEFIDLHSFLFKKREVKPDEVGKTAWVVLGYPLFMWPLTLVILLFAGVIIALLGGG